MRGVLGYDAHVLAVLSALAVAASACKPELASPPPGPESARFHHLHLSSTDPSAAVDFYARAFTTVTKTAWNGFEGFTTRSRLSTRTGNIYVLFDKVGKVTAPGPDTQSAVAHFGWNVPDARSYLERFRGLQLQLVPMHADADGNIVTISSDGLPGYLTTKQIADARTKGVVPTRTGGFLYVQGPDGALIESYGNFPAERFTHIHMYHRDPICAQQWYARHLGAQVAATHLHHGPGSADNDPADPELAADCRRPFAEPTYPSFDKGGRVRQPDGYVLFDDVGLPIWPYAGTLVSTRGQTVDHIGLGVHDLRTTIARLRTEGVAVLEDIHQWSDTLAAVIEGPDRVALELIQLR